MHSLGLQLTLIWWNFIDETEVTITTVFFQKKSDSSDQSQNIYAFLGASLYCTFMLKSLSALCLVFSHKKKQTRGRNALIQRLIPQKPQMKNIQ